MSNAVAIAGQRVSLVEKLAAKYHVDPSKMLSTLKATAFKQKDAEVTNEQMMALLVVADQYGLNPWTKEIFAFPDKQNGIVPVVGVDGWSRIINDHPQSDGFEFRQSDSMVTLADAQSCPEWMEVVIHRKDRSHPIVVREYLDEVYRPLRTYDGGGKQKSGPWQTHTKRFLRHKTLIQGARIAYGFGGIYDEDEAERIVERDMGAIQPAQVVAMPKAKSEPKVEPAKAKETIDGSTGEIVAESDAKPVSENMLNVIKAKMEASALGEADLRTKFGHGYDGVTTDNFSAVTDWISNPAG